MRNRKLNILMVAVALTLSFILSAQAHDSAANLTTETLQIQFLQVTGKLPVLAIGVTDLKFNELYKMPVGPRGIEPSAKLQSLNNKLVRIVGYMAKQETLTPGLFIMTPLAVNIGDEDDKFADDMPANSIFVHLEGANQVVNYVPGLINVVGVLNVGSKHEIDGRISYVQLKLDSKLSGLVEHDAQALK